MNRPRARGAQRGAGGRARIAATIATVSTEARGNAPGVRVVALGERPSVIPAYATVKLRDVVIQPGAKTPDNVMMNDMLCHMTEGELSDV